MPEIISIGYFIRDLIVLVATSIIVVVLLAMGGKTKKNLGFSYFIRAFNSLLLAFSLIVVAQVIGVLLRTTVLNNDPTYSWIRSVMLTVGALLLLVSSVMIYLPFARGEYTIVPIASEPADSIRYGAYWGERGRAYLIFTELTKRYRMPGIAVTRDPPDMFRRKLGLKLIPVMWVSTVQHGDAVSPTKLEVIMDNLRRFLETANIDKVILIDCVEYFILENGEDAVLKFITSIKDFATLNRGLVIVTVDKESLNERTFSILTSELRPITDLEKTLAH
ncbi:hypothetical protein APY94_11455 [Thermococcus celericrescens]|uniref:DUF835 domain-containing protein n=1 Tax=Thermococcus celericrescens TaxID=227598 RepID=A0A117IT72_9EURY|nr:DUF835 domain-containing protein [Thermococcus celericrescens]KUH31929.1 hypothetical protein APY94_11455 [Thermococcus celericrescens]